MSGISLNCGASEQTTGSKSLFSVSLTSSEKEQPKHPKINNKLTANIFFSSLFILETKTFFSCEN